MLTAEAGGSSRAGLCAAVTSGPSEPGPGERLGPPRAGRQTCPLSSCCCHLCTSGLSSAWVVQKAVNEGTPGRPFPHAVRLGAALTRWDGPATGTVPKEKQEWGAALCRVSSRALETLSPKNLINCKLTFCLNINKHKRRHRIKRNKHTSGMPVLTSILENLA